MTSHTRKSTYDTDTNDRSSWWPKTWRRNQRGQGGGRTTRQSRTTRTTSSTRPSGGNSSRYHSSYADDTTCYPESWSRSAIEDWESRHTRGREGREERVAATAMSGGLEPSRRTTLKKKRRHDRRRPHSSRPRRTTRPAGPSRHQPTSGIGPEWESAIDALVTDKTSRPYSSKSSRPTRRHRTTRKRASTQTGRSYVTELLDGKSEYTQHIPRFQEVLKDISDSSIESDMNDPAYLAMLIRQTVDQEREAASQEASRATVKGNSRSDDSWWRYS